MKKKKDKCTHFKKSERAVSAACLISRLPSLSMFNSPSRKSGSQSIMLMSGTLSRTVIHPTWKKKIGEQNKVERKKLQRCNKSYKK